MGSKVQTVSTEEAKAKPHDILRAANAEDLVVPAWQALREVPCISALRGSARGCFGDAGAFVRAMRDEWP